MPTLTLNDFMRHVVKLVCTILFFAAVRDAWAQGPKTSVHSPVSVEVMPEFPGGIQRFYQYIGQNYKYPAAAIKARVSGRVMLQFVIEKDGSVTDVKVLKGLGYGTTEEAVRVIKRSPRWKPGIQKGKKVRVLFTLPLKLELP